MDDQQQLAFSFSERKPVQRAEDSFLEWRQVNGYSAYVSRQIFFGAHSMPAPAEKLPEQIELPIACTCSFRPYPHIITDPIERMRHEWEPMK
jgi:hypothetical protein